MFMNVQIYGKYFWIHTVNARKKHKCGDRIMFTDGLNRFGCLSPLSLSLTTFRPLFLSSKSIPPRPMTHYCKRDPSFRPVRKNIRVPFLHLASPFLTEKRNMYLQFFLTKFWQNIFAKEMWRNVKSSIMKAVPPQTASWYTLNHSPKILIPLSDIAHFAVR